MKSSKSRWAGHVAHMGEKRHAGGETQEKCQGVVKLVMNLQVP
jgi:hypothetical protein